MVMPGRVVQNLENLPERPPTPPRESSTHSEPKSHVSRLFSKRSGTQSPINSPTSSNESATYSADKAHKKVGFSEFVDSQENVRASQLATPSNPRALRPLVSSDNKPKSILKPYNGVNSVDRSQGITKLSPPHTYPSFAVMLESIVKQLAGADRSSRIDAYQILNGALKASDHIPDLNALQSKMGLISQFILRDVVKSGDNGFTDTKLANHALILLASLLWKPDVAASLPSEFCVQIIDHAISAFEASITSKDVLKHLMFVVGVQSFSAKVMTPDRIGRLLAALQNVEDHVKGRSIVLGRLTIYQRILRQNKLAMVVYSDWIDHLFTDMLSTFKDIRNPAISFGFEAALRLGTEKQISKAIVELFDSSQDDTIRFVDFYASRLRAMMKNKQDAVSVPQIWSVVILFLRSRPLQVEQWSCMKQWLQVIQECFNCSDHEVKMQANLAWNRLIYTVKPDDTTSKTMVKMLLQPLSGQMRRKSAGKHAKEARQSAISGYCNLLYYSLKPTAPFQQLDLFWDEYVIPMANNLCAKGNRKEVDSNGGDLRQLCAILGALFNAYGPTIWSESRAIEDTPIHTQELPGLDPRWVRKNSLRVCSALEPLIQTLLLDFATQSSPIHTVWQAYMSTVAAAGLKEVKVSNETMGVVAWILNMIRNLWRGGANQFQANASTSNTFITSIVKILDVMIVNLGLLPFTEKLLSVTQLNTFLVVATPSHKPSTYLGDVKPPLHHLVALIAQPSPGLVPDGELYQRMNSLVKPFFDTRKSKWFSVDLARDLSQLLNTQSQVTPSSIALWQSIASCVEDAMLHGSTADNSSNEQPLGAEYRNLVSVLEVGALLSPEEMLLVWRNLFQVACDQVTREAGETGRAISIIDPLAKYLHHLGETTRRPLSESYLISIVDNASYPKERHVLHAAQRRLWGTAITGQRSVSFDPYSHLYGFLSLALQQSYNQLSVDCLDTCGRMLASLSDLLRRIPKELVLDALVKIQAGISLWVTDSDLKLRSKIPVVLNLFISVGNLWAAICSIISNMPRLDSAVLQQVDQLISAGLNSNHKSIVNSSITFWNETFGLQSELTYPPLVKSCLTQLRLVAELSLPDFPQDSDNMISTNGISFLEDSQVDDNVHYGPPTSSRRTGQSSLASPFPRGTVRSSILKSSPLSDSSRHPNRTTPDPTSRRKIAKKVVTPKFRHNDSQIQFETIESSPTGHLTQDSQVLTDRQREVRDRQNTDAALFSDIRSSPRSSRSLRRESSAVSSKLSEALSEGSKLMTPDVNKPSKTDDDFITSSPTPRRGELPSAFDSDAIGPPSSPPEQTRELETPDPVEASHLSFDYNFLQDGWDIPSSPPEKPSQTARPEVSSPPPQLTLPSIQAPPESSSAVPLDVNQQIHVNAFRPETPVPEKNLSDTTQPTPRTPAEVFVDALSTPQDVTTSNAEEDEREGSIQYTDLDETSMLRLANEIEDATNKTTEKTQYMSLPDLSPASKDEMEVDSSAVKKYQDLYSLQTSGSQSNAQKGVSGSPQRAITRNRRKAIQLEESASLPESSAIPETPDNNVLKAGAEHPASEVSTNRRSSARVRQRADSNSQNTPPSQPAKRRKVGADRFSTSTSDEVPDSQDGQVDPQTAVVDFAVQDNSQLSDIIVVERVPTKRRGRPSRQERDAQRELERQEAEAEQLRLQMSIEAQSQEEDRFGDSSIESTSIPSEELAGIEFDPDTKEQVSGKEADQAEDLPGSIVGTAVEMNNEERSTGSGIIANLSKLLQDLKSAKLSRMEATAVENMMWDLKGELFAAEKRGREE